MLVTTGILAMPAALLLIYAAVHDFAARTVPNWLPLCLLALGVLLRLLDHSLLIGLVIGVATFGLLFVIWMLGGIGGGDVKLWAATVLLIPPFWQAELNFFLRVVLLGGLLALLYLALCLVVRRPHASRAGSLPRRIIRAEAWRVSRRAPLPYALAIAGSALLTLIPLSLQH